MSNSNRSATKQDYEALLDNPAYEDALEGIRASLYREFKTASDRDQLAEILLMVRTVDRFDQQVRARVKSV